MLYDPTSASFVFLFSLFPFRASSIRGCLRSLLHEERENVKYKYLHVNYSREHQRRGWYQNTLALLRKSFIPEVFFLPPDVFSNVHPLIKIIRPLLLLLLDREKERERERDQRKEDWKSKNKSIRVYYTYTRVCV